MLVVEASLEEQAVPVGMEPAKGARALEHEDTGGALRPAGGLCHEVAHQAVDEAADLPVKPLVMAEEHAKDLGKGEDELPVRQPQQELLVDVLSQKQGALLGARGTEVEDAAAEGAEVIQSAVGVCALDSGDTPAIVAAGEEPLHRPVDPLEAELPELLGELGLVAGEELGEVGTEEPLERACSPLAVGARGCG